MIFMDELISVIVPVYNTGAYLEKCVDSILDQDYKNIEIILIDDGSTDKTTVKLCNKLEEKHKKIRTIHKKNGGSSSARNLGILASHGQYLAFVDSDDYIERDMYTSLISDIKKYNIKVAIGGMIIDGHKNIIRPDSVTSNGVYNNIKIMHYFLLGSWHSVCTNLYHRSLFEHNKFPEGETNEDYYMNFRIFMNVRSVSVNVKCFYHYVKRKGSNTTSAAHLKNLDWIKHTRYVRDTILMDDVGAALGAEAEYQYIFSNIVLGNKALISISAGSKQDALIIYSKITATLKRLRISIIKNSFLSWKYRIMGIAMSVCPLLYKSIVLKLIEWRNLNE